MRNFILIFAFLFCAPSAILADNTQYDGVQILLTIKKGNTSGGTEAPRTLVNPPIVYHNDYTLYFCSECENSVIEIKDENGESVYCTTIIDVPKSLIIPESLSGTYEIYIIRGNITFSGHIVL